MPLYMVERAFAEQLELTSEDVKLIDDINGDEGVSWLFSFLSADRRRTYCLYEAPSPGDHLRRPAGRHPGRRDRRGGPGAAELATRLRDYSDTMSANAD